MGFYTECEPHRVFITLASAPLQSVSKMKADLVESGKGFDIERDFVFLEIGIMII